MQVYPDYRRSLAHSVAKKAFDNVNRTQGLEGEGFELGLLKMGIEEGGSLLPHFRYIL